MKQVTIYTDGATGTNQTAVYTRQCAKSCAVKYQPLICVHAELNLVKISGGIHRNIDNIICLFQLFQ